MFSSTLIALLPLLSVLTVQAAPTRRDTESGVYIYASRDGQCITPDVSSPDQIVNGTPVVSKSCDQALKWDIALVGSGSVSVHGNNGFALDAGQNPGNNGALKVWQSYPGLYQQTWYHTYDLRIAITGGNQCLDQGDNGIQTYQCTTGNTNQVFYTRYPDVNPSSEPGPCYGTGGSYVTYTSAGTVTSTLSVPVPACAQTAR